MASSKHPPPPPIDRKAFFRLLSEWVSVSGRYGTKFALLLIDISRFHRVNHLHGYHIGDRILLKLEELLGTVRRPQDVLYRIGDNRFALVLKDIMNPGHAELAAQKIQRLLEMPFQSGDDPVPVSCTVGISLYPTHAHTAENLLRECEDVLNHARSTGEPVGISQREEEDEAVSELWDLEMELARALDKQQLQVFYQPQVSINSGAPIGAEALIRWVHPHRGMVRPDIFIPIAEKTGLIKPITNWLLNTVLRHSTKWTDRWGELSVSVNIPADFILRPYLKDFVANALQLWSNKRITLVLEIVERSLIEEPERCFKVLNDLRSMGIRISIDDFGTGYSTLSYFKFIPVDELKIDQSFINNLTADKANQSIVRLITALAHSFEMAVVAEGIEDANTLQYIRKIGVDIGQGYHLARPMPAEEFRNWLTGYQIDR